MTRTAFIGVGHMGGGMAANQVKGGREVVAFDLSAQALDRARQNGCDVASSVAEAVQGADLVVTMLPAGQHVRLTYAEAVLPNAPSGALLIDCSTIEVDAARDVANLAAEKGFRFADAPVSGGTAAADAGTLTFMVGCEPEAFPDVAEALRPMGANVIHAGPKGAGQAAKICNNMLLGISMLGVCEALALAERLGLGADKFFDIAGKSSGQCWSLTTYCPWPGVGPTTPADRGYEGGFLTALMLKDLRLAQAAAARANASTPLGAQAEAIYALFDRLGYGEKDFSAALQLMRGRLDELH